MNTKYEAATPAPVQDHLRELTTTEMKVAAGATGVIRPTRHKETLVPT